MTIMIGGGVGGTTMVESVERQSSQGSDVSMRRALNDEAPG